MDEGNFIPKVITIQPDSITESEEIITQANQEAVTNSQPFNSQSQTFPIFIEDEAVPSDATNDIRATFTNVSSTSRQPSASSASSNFQFTRGTGFVKASCGNIISESSSPLLNTHSSRPNILSRSSQPNVTKVTPKLVVLPTHKRNASATLLRPNQTNPVVLSIGNLGTITEQRYFSVPVAGNYSTKTVRGTGLSSTVSTSVVQTPRSQLSRVPKTPPVKPPKIVKKPSHPNKTNDNPKTKSQTIRDQDKVFTEDKILGVKQNDIFFCNYCNYYAVFQTTDIFKHYLKHHKKSCTGINCNKQFNTEIDMQCHIYNDHPELRGKLAPKEVLLETTCLETFKKPIYVFSRTAMTKLLSSKQTGEEITEGKYL